jgi:hypothetical protein
MAITFNTSGLPGGLSATGLYGHIRSAYVKKVDATASVAVHWILPYEVFIFRDATARGDGSANIPFPRIDRFKITLANLTSLTAADSSPFSLAYADLKSKISGFCSSIADA